MRRLFGLFTHLEQFPYLQNSLQQQEQSELEGM